MIPLIIGLTAYALALVFGTYKLGMSVSKMGLETKAEIHKK